MHVMNISFLYLLSFGAASLHLLAAEPAEVEGYVKHEGDCFGHDISHHVLSVAECAEQCTSNAECAGFGVIDQSVFQGASTATCLLKSHVCTSLNTKEGLYFYAPLTGPDEVEGYEKHTGDCSGHDISHHVLSVAECAEQCTGNAECAGFGVIDQSVFQGASTATCMLKSHVCTSLNTKEGLYFYSPHSEVVVDVEGYVQQAGACFFSDIIEQYYTSLADCAARCTGSNRCAGFDYIDHKVVTDKPDVTCILRTENCVVPNRISGYSVYRPYYEPLEVEGYTKYEGWCNGDTTDSYYTDVADCAAKCSSRHYCEGFGFMDQKHYSGYIRGRTCELKTYNCAYDMDFSKTNEGVYTYVKHS